MKPSKWRIVYGLAVCGASLWSGREAAAQGGGVGVPSLAPSPTVQTMQGLSLSAQAASAPLADPSASTGGASLPQGGILNGPMAPLLYGSMIGASMPQGQTTGNSAAMANLGTTQLGMMMMLANQPNGGIGSGRLSGTRTRTALGQRTSLGTPPSSSAKPRSSDRPGGLASRYFNRTAGQPAYPRSYFNRRPSYFP